MTKVINLKITKCTECPFYREEHHNLHWIDNKCSVIDGKEIENSNTIPSFCPLPDIN